MKTSTKSLFYQWSIVLISIMVLNACSKEESGNGYSGAVVEQSFEVTVNFDPSNYPPLGSKLDLNLYYSSISGKGGSNIKPDFSYHYVLTQHHIDNGIKAPFKFFDKKEEIYVGAYVDTDQNGVINSGDYAVFYNDMSVEDIETGSGKPENVANEESITLIVNRVVEELVVEKVVDYDGNEYKTVVIGDQLWFAENLKVTHYNNGDPIATGLNNSEWGATKLGAYAIFPHHDIDGLNSDQDVVDKFGLLYNWNTVDNPGGVCPQGWKVPLDTDWKILEQTIGMSKDDANEAGWRGGLAPLLMSTDGWIENVGEDAYGFRGLPVGTRTFNGSQYYRNGTHAYFWTASPSGTNADQALRRLFQYDNININRSSRPPTEGMSVRCVKE